MGIITKELNSLKCRSAQMRLTLLEMLPPGRVGHLGGSASAMDIVATLYFYKMDLNKIVTGHKGRDYFIMSKGHSVPAQYAALTEAGMISRRELGSLKTLGGLLQGHPDMSTPGMEAVTGSLGQGLSIGAGLAYGHKYLNGSENQVYVLCGDGEMAEGQLWEAAMFASFYRLNNLTMVLDQNGLQASGECRVVMDIPNLRQKWEAFGWSCHEVDGHDHEALAGALDRSSESPRAIIAQTVKGKGFPFAENVVGFHNGAMTQEQWEQGKEYLEAIIEELGCEI